MSQHVLTESQVETFLKDGVLVADNIFTNEEIEEAIQGLHQTFWRDYRINVNDLKKSGHRLTYLSSTHGAGGVLDVFYPSFKLELASNPKLFQATTELWSHAYENEGTISTAAMTSNDSQGPDEHMYNYDLKFHPYGAFDPNKGYMYIDRIGFRLPTDLSIQIASSLSSSDSKDPYDQHDKNPYFASSSSSSSSRQKQLKHQRTGIQRSLTPHLDCCPETFYSTKQKSKWRPIQCFISLTDNLEPHTGGFEAALGFHKVFSTWALKRREQSQSSSSSSSSSSTSKCVGEYTHIHPKYDLQIMKSVQHVPVRKGSVVFFDNRIPHANSYRHLGSSPRIVIYCSFLPDVPINREYAKRQLQDYYKGNTPRDTWIRVSDQDQEKRKDGGVDDLVERDNDPHDDSPSRFQNQMSNDSVPITGSTSEEGVKDDHHSFSSLGRKLMMMDPW